jgi:hypothetical protein
LNGVVVKETVAAKPILRLLVILGPLLWVLPLDDLLAHISDSPTVWQRYSLCYVMLRAQDWLPQG